MHPRKTSNPVDLHHYGDVLAEMLKNIGLAEVAFCYEGLHALEKKV